MPITEKQVTELRGKMAEISALAKAFAALAMGLGEDSEDIEDIDVCVMVGIDKRLSVGSTCSPEQSLEMCRALAKSIENGESLVMPHH